MIRQVGDHWVVGRRKTWLPGHYATYEAAWYAGSTCGHEDIHDAQDVAEARDGAGARITLEDLMVVTVPRKAAPEPIPVVEEVVEEEAVVEALPELVPAPEPPAEIAPPPPAPEPPPPLVVEDIWVMVVGTTNRAVYRAPPADIRVVINDAAAWWYGVRGETPDAIELMPTEHVALFKELTGHPVLQGDGVVRMMTSAGPVSIRAVTQTEGETNEPNEEDK